MRILMLCHEFLPGEAGGAQGVGFLALELARRHQVDVITKRYLDVPDKETFRNLSVYRVPAWGETSRGFQTLGSTMCYSFFAFRLACALLLRNRYHIISGHFGIPAGSIAVFLGRLFRVPSVVTLIGAEIYDPPRSEEILAIPLAKQLVWGTIRLADEVAALSRSITQHVEHDFKMFRPCRVIPFGVPKIPDLCESVSTGRKRDRSEMSLLCVGRLVPRKRHLDLLKALTHLPSDLEVILRIVGDGAERENITAQIKRLGLGSRVQLLGLLPEAEKWNAYRDADMFILVSNHESQGLVYVEAMQAGLPVIAGDNGGQCDFIQDGLNGILVPVGNVNAIAHAVETLARDPLLRMRMGEESRRIAATLTASQTAMRYQAVFEGLCARKYRSSGLNAP